MSEKIISPRRKERARQVAREYTAIVVNRWVSGTLDNEPKFIDECGSIYRMSAPLPGEEFNKATGVSLQGLQGNRDRVPLYLKPDIGDEIQFTIAGNNVTYKYGDKVFTSDGHMALKTSNSMLDWLALTTLESIYNQLEK